MPIQSTFFDLVLGQDIHLVAIPTPAGPVPTPIPMPFVGMVFDPFGLALGAAIGMATGGGPGVVAVNSLPATNCGTNVTNMLTLPHVSAPGVLLVTAGKPVAEGDAELYFGSKDVTLAGSLGVRLGDIALSCSDPVRLPTSVVLAVPKGMPVLNLNPMVPDLNAIAMALIMKGLGALARAGARLFRRIRASNFMRRLSQRLGGCHPPANASRWRQMWSRTVRFVTGHPVDVVTGNLFTDVTEVELPGPLPLVLERVYESAGSAQSRALGFGWAHTLDESLWAERGRVVVRCGDGREVEFLTWDLPTRVMRPGDALERVIHKMTLRCIGRDRFEVEHANGRIHEFAPVEGDGARRARLVRIRSRDGHHQIGLSYDRHGRLEWVRDSAGRLIGFEHDGNDRLTALKLPLSREKGWYKHREYRYDVRGDLVEVRDAEGHAWRYQYEGHLLVQETDRAGLSFYFQYDGRGSLSRCIRTWGDGGIHDHEIDYDVRNKKTVVSDSLGATTVYAFNLRNQVESVTDAHGGVTRHDYDPDTGGETLTEDPSGARTTKRYDSRGNLVEVIRPDGGALRLEYQGDLPVRALDARGGEWRWSYSREGRLVEYSTPSGQRSRFGWEQGMLRWTEAAPGRRVDIDYDAQRNIAAVHLPTGAVQHYQADNLGRLVRVKNVREGVLRYRHDTEGRVVEAQSATTVTLRMVYDAEGNLVEVKDTTRHVRMGYGHYHRVVWRDEGDTRQSFEYDTEGRLSGMVNEAGERYAFILDAMGRVREEVGFDGSRHVFLRDAAGRITKTLSPNHHTSEHRYDAVGRLVEVTHADGTFARYGYDLGGLMVLAENESTKVEFERDAMGRVTMERVAGREVRSTYGLDGARTEMTTSLGARQAIARDASGSVEALFFGHAEDFEGVADVCFARDGFGLEEARCFKSGVDVEWERDPAGRPLGRRTVRRDGPPRAGGPKTGRAPRELDALTYHWRGEDQLAEIVDASRGARVHDHDARGRLIRERRPDAVVERAMDAVGNVYRTADRADRHYGKGGRLEQSGAYRYTHDAEGNQIQRIGPDGTWCYEWNGHGMLKEVSRPDRTKVSFEYDPLARRTARRVVSPEGVVTAETTFTWDGHVVVHEMDSGQGLVTWHFEPDTFQPIAKEQGGRRWNIASDFLGVPTEMYDEVGELAWKMQLDVFGVARVEVGEARDCPWRWPGQYEDEETGLYYNRFRMFDPEQGRFLSRDPIGLLGNTNLFSYPSDPVTGMDPLGWIPAPAGLPDVPGVYIITNQATGQSYVGSAGIGSQGMATRVSSVSGHPKAQQLLGMEGTVVQYMRVNMPEGLSASERNNILRYFEAQQYQRQVAAGFTMLNGDSIQGANKVAHAEGLIERHGVTVSKRRVTCR
ncbi:MULTISPECIES: DUF6531 domain-containing protein [Corallococcus]|uniref:DUF6531 domain-containing protein n=1 Tax=Corallococcus TaxID=83461 RepID=UPI000EC63DAE|nr:MULTISPECIES: DUF6531 domain-containing protein [Corallococcus]NPC72041.1 hypothetical protein [Corallococcus exiguus]NPD22358.1 hypothetical protein [Corallococcus exiguus]RKI01214.1 hypothetical protein D7Y04_11725 [Corallococcus sp. AB038B]